MVSTDDSGFSSSSSFLQYTVCGSVKLAPGPRQPITLLLFRACMRECAVCSGLTDCFSIIGTLIIAPTLSQTSAFLPPAFFLHAVRCSRLWAGPAMVWHGSRREKTIGQQKKTRHLVRRRRQIWAGRNMRACPGCQFQWALGGEADL